MRIACLIILLISAAFSQTVVADESNGATKTAQSTRGKLIGARVIEHPDWFKQSFLEIAEDVAEADAENKHVLMFFHLEGCPYCNKMVEENFQNSSYHEFLRDNFDVIAINIRGDREVVFNEEVSLSEKELSRHLGVRATPTILFLNAENTPVLRLNGYRSAEAFKYALDFVHDKAYEHTTLARYVEKHGKDDIYILRDHPNFAAVDDLSQLPDKPLMVLFEDRTCDECDTLHDNTLAQDETRAILDHFTVVRLDALSEQPIVDPAGNQTTPKAFAAALGISYRPGVVLFDRGKEILRIDGMHYRYHFQGMLSYVGERHYERYPSMRDYLREREEKILSSGQDINIIQ